MVLGLGVCFDSTFIEPGALGLGVRSMLSAVRRTASCSRELSVAWLDLLQQAKPVHNV